MALFKADGTRVTKANVTTAAEADPIVVITTDLYKRQPYPTGSGTDKDISGDLKTLFCRAGAKMRRSELDAHFPAPTITSITPATGAAAGNTLVTITGTNLDGTTAVTFGGTAGTQVTQVSSTQVTVRTPAKSVGTYDVVLTDDGGSVTKTGGFTYA